MVKTREHERIEKYNESRYIGCPEKGRHQFGENLWNQKGHYWFRKCIFCGKVDRWRTNFYADGAYGTREDIDEERKIIARTK